MLVNPGECRIHSVIFQDDAVILGAEIMLDVGLYRLDQQVACQREACCIVSSEAEKPRF